MDQNKIVKISLITTVILLFIWNTSLQLQINKVVKKQSDIEENVYDATSRLDNVESDVEDTSSRIDDNESRLDDVEYNSSDNENRINDLEMDRY